MSTDILIGFEMEFKKRANGRELAPIYPLLLKSEVPEFEWNSSADGSNDLRGGIDGQNIDYQESPFKTSKGWVNEKGERRYFDGNPGEIASAPIYLSSDTNFSETNYINHLLSLVSSRRIISELCDDTRELELGMYHLNLSLPNEDIKRRVEQEKEKIKAILAFYTLGNHISIQTYKDGGKRCELRTLQQFKTAKYQALFDTVATLTFFDVLNHNNLNSINTPKYQLYFSKLFKEYKMDFLVPVLDDYHKNRASLLQSERSECFHTDHDKTYIIFTKSTEELAKKIGN